MLKKIVCAAFAAMMLASISIPAFASETSLSDTAVPAEVNSIVGDKDSGNLRWNPFCEHAVYEKIVNKRTQDCMTAGQHTITETFYKCKGTACNEFYRESSFSCGTCYDGNTVR